MKFSGDVLSWPSIREHKPLGYCWVAEVPRSPSALVYCWLAEVPRSPSALVINLIISL